ncbi:MAG: hypothetical protein Ta2B_01660 [Termitinemataceae bacterium]|nr:MAG: hypothetical protein Ta2B_01660 [Termitinemataceae bacterium]
MKAYSLIAFLMCAVLFSCDWKVNKNLLDGRQEEDYDKSAANITLFCVSADDGITYGSTINETSDPLGQAEIEVRIPPIYNIASIAPLVATSTGAYYTPTAAQDFSNSEASPIPYIVTAADGSKKTYMVSIIEDSSISVDPNESDASVSFYSFDLTHLDGISEPCNRIYAVSTNNQKNIITITIEYQYEIPTTLAPDSYLDKMMRGTSIEIGFKIYEPDDPTSPLDGVLPFETLYDLHYKRNQLWTFEDSNGKPKTYRVYVVPALSTAPYYMASGGNVFFVTNDDGSKDEVHVFKSNGDLSFNSNMQYRTGSLWAWVLLVSGGGEGSLSGGGGGGVVDSAYDPTNPSTPLGDPYTFELTSHTGITMYIGEGGNWIRNHTTDFNRGAPGGKTYMSTYMGRLFYDDEMAGGGGGGGEKITSAPSHNDDHSWGSKGGSGGGTTEAPVYGHPDDGRSIAGPITVDSVTYYVLGNAGGPPNLGSGGGAGAAGVSGGGRSAGYTSRITGTEIEYGCGGSAISSEDTLPNTGNGGDKGKDGASGIIVVRFPYTPL